MRLAIIFAACLAVTFCIAVTISAGVLTIPAKVTSFTVSVGDGVMTMHNITSESKND